MMFLVLVATLTLICLPSVSQGDNTALPVTIPTKVISTSQQAVCPSEELQRLHVSTPQWCCNHTLCPVSQKTCTSVPVELITQYSSQRNNLWGFHCRKLQVCLWLDICVTVLSIEF